MAVTFGEASEKSPKNEFQKLLFNSNLFITYFSDNESQFQISKLSLIISLKVIKNNELKGDPR